jgi:hypothetical protein
MAAGSCRVNLGAQLIHVSTVSQRASISPVALALAILAAIMPFPSPSMGAAQAPSAFEKPMAFTLVREGPVESCGQNCREWVSASGTVTPDTRRDFENFARGRDLRGAVVILESPGGNVSAGLWLGREFRHLGMATTVGKTELLPPDKSGERRATLSPRAYCGSICPFILLGGVLRHVPPGAKVLVHQTWPKVKLQDVLAATYSALELGSAQMALGKLAQYTVEMGGDIGLFEAAMRVPQWEGSHTLTADEIRRFGLDNAANVFDKEAVKLEGSKRQNPVPAPTGLRPPGF